MHIRSDYFLKMMCMMSFFIMSFIEIFQKTGLLTYEYKTTHTTENR